MHAPACSAHRAWLLRSSVAVLGALALSMVVAAPALAGGWWRVSSRAAPSFLAPGGKATIILTASNVGDTGVLGSNTPVSVRDVLPAGLEATAIKGAPAFEEVEEGHQMSCDLATLTCTSAPETLPPFQALDVEIQVNVKPGATTGELNKLNVQGGEQEDRPGVQPPGASLEQPITVNGSATPFGVEDNGYALSPEEEGGAPDTSAGSHPFQLTTTLNLNQAVEKVGEFELVAAAPALPKDLSFNLPPGLIGDPLGVAQCPSVDFLAITPGALNGCQPESAVGVVLVTLDEPAQFHNITRAVPLWNLEPANGEPARFGFEVLKVPVVLDTAVRSRGDYGVTVSVNDAPQAAQILASEVTIWGVPGEASHDSSRGWACLLGGVYFNHEKPCQPPNPHSNTAFLTLPTSCTGPVKSTVEGHSWPLKTLAGEAGQIFALDGSSTEDTLPGMHGCEQVPFSPSIKLEGETHAADTPTGLKADVHVPQQGTLEGGALSEADVRTSTVTLPEGVLLSPSSANGLQACSQQQIGYEGPPGTDLLAEGAPQPLRFSSEPAHCPDASKVGTVRVHTPLLEHELEGAVYLAAQNDNPFGSLLALYVVAEDPFSGIRVKLAGEGKLNGQTGQLTTSFVTTPQVPFEDFQLQFPGGPRASLTTPPVCGSYQTAAIFTPWTGTAPVQSLSTAGEFDITSGPGGSSCANPQPFAPTFQAGSANAQAGAFAPFTLQITRPDSNQPLTGVAVHLPPGAAAMLSTIKQCSEPQASAGECGPESLIGTATATSGLGPDPYAVTGGRVYITGPYAGAPFGLTIVTPAVAGPFNLGNVIVRSTINVDPSTAAVTISSGLPTIVQGHGMPSSGIPLQLQSIAVDVDRPNFEFNPTSCNPMQVTGLLSGGQGAQAQVSSPFQVGGCAGLPFKPAFAIFTQGQTSKTNGASLTVRVTSTKGQANIAKTVLTLPQVLPARLTTLQKACVAATFEANPAACPEGSVVGSATVHTPVLSRPLTGPAYLVSHGNAAFPDVEFVLQGEGITLILDGQTDIKHGITTSTFNAVPDAPVETFEAVLPEGPHSALGATSSLCGQALSAPTLITGQNGQLIRQTTKITVTGCQAGKATRAQLLAKALAACRKKYKHDHHKRISCERQARKHYAAKKAGQKTRR